MDKLGIIARLAVKADREEGPIHFDVEDESPFPEGFDLDDEPRRQMWLLGWMVRERERTGQLGLGFDFSHERVDQDHKE